MNRCLEVLRIFFEVFAFISLINFYMGLLVDSDFLIRSFLPDFISALWQLGISGPLTEISIFFFKFWIFIFQLPYLLPPYPHYIITHGYTELFAVKWPLLPSHPRLLPPLPRPPTCLLCSRTFATRRCKVPLRTYLPIVLSFSSFRSPPCFSWNSSSSKVLNLSKFPLPRINLHILPHHRAASFSSSGIRGERRVDLLRYHRRHPRARRTRNLVARRHETGGS